MKTLFATMALAIAFTSVSAQAAPKQMNTDGLDVLNVIADNQSDFDKLNREGNRITSVTVEKKNSKETIYRITAQNCRMFPAQCLGGATLTIVRKLMPSAPPHFEYETKIVKIR